MPGRSHDLGQVFDFARDYLGLLKAALIAAGIVPPGLEGSGQGLGEVLDRLVGPGLGLEVVTKVNDIPKGSRLAVSTNLLAAIVTACMRATGQIESLDGPLSESQRRIVAARAILGEWLAGSGGGWQDSGGIWPGVKMIEGRAARPGDPEFGVSRGRLLPDHHIYSEAEVGRRTRELLCESFVLVHGGMAQNVGPILEMVTEKYLLRCQPEWQARQEAMAIMRAIESALEGGDIREIARPRRKTFRPPPDHHPLGLEPLYPNAHRPHRGALRQRLLGLSDAGRNFRRRHGLQLRSAAEDGSPGLLAGRNESSEARAPASRCPSPWSRWSTILPSTIRARRPSCGPAAMRRCRPDTMPSACRCGFAKKANQLSPAVRGEIDRFAAACRGGKAEGGEGERGKKPEGERGRRGEGEMCELTSAAESPRLPVSPSATRLFSAELLFSALFPKPAEEREGAVSLRRLLEENGFDPELHEANPRRPRAGRIGLSQNRLPLSSTIEDVLPGDVVDCTAGRKAIVGHSAADADFASPPLPLSPSPPLPLPSARRPWLAARWPC